MKEERDGRDASDVGGVAAREDAHEEVHGEGRLPRGGRLSPLKIIVLDYDKGSAISSADVDTLGKVTVPWTDAFATEPRRVSLSLKYKGSKAGKVDVTFEALAANDDGAPFPAQRTSTSADDAEARIRELEAQRHEMREIIRGERTEAAALRAENSRLLAENKQLRGPMGGLPDLNAYPSPVQSWS